MTGDDVITHVSLSLC